MAEKQGIKQIAANRQARHEYFVEESMEAGIELNRLYGLVKQQQGLTLIPLQAYFKGSRVKIELGVCRGKKLYDKRADAAKRDAQRDIERAMRGRG